MTTTFNKVALSLILVGFAFGIFAYVSQQTNMLNNVWAYSGGGGDGGCCGGGSSTGGGSSSNDNDRGERDDWDVPKPAPKVTPSCDLFTINNKKSITRTVGGDRVALLRWQTTNATTVSIDRGIGKRANVDNMDGKAITIPNTAGTYTYTLTATSKDNIKKDCSVTVKVVDKPVTKVPGCTDPNATNYNSNATENDGSCAYPNNKVTPSCDAFTVNKAKVYKGETVVLKWQTTNATNVSINRGVGSVAADNTTGKTVTMPTAIGAYTFILTATSKDSISKTCSVTVSVVDKPVTKVPGCTDPNATNYNSNATENDGSCKYPETPKYPKCDFFRVNDDEVKKGTRVTLSWGTTNANRVEINQGIGRVNADGDYEVVINNDIDFRLTAYGDDGRTDTCIASVDVETSGGGGGGSPLPRCELKASDRKIKAGERVELSWETRYGRELTIYEGDEDDDEIYETDDDDDVEEGEITVRPRRDTTYTLIVERGSRDRKCKVDIDVEDEDDDVVVIDDRDQKPRVAGITLTQVPYTGFEAGPMLTTFFYALLALWGMFVAYHFVIRKKDKKLY